MNGAAVQLTIDARKAFDTGIGTYVRQVVPRVLMAWPEARARILISPGTQAMHSYLAGCEVSFTELDAAPFSLREQWALRTLVNNDGLFWATSLAHPLYTRGRMANTVYDVVQLSLPGPLGGSAGKRLMARPFFDSLRRRSCQAMFISEFTAREFRRLVGEPVGASEVIALGVDDAWFVPQELAASASPGPMAGPYFVMLGNLRPHKNLALVLAALAMCGPDSAQPLPHRLLLIGPDDPTASADPALRKLLVPVAQRVSWAGRLPQPDVARALAQAEALLFPSRYEGFGLPVLEAMACGCPVVVARNGISPQLAGETALTFDPNDPASLATAMRAQVHMSHHDRSHQIQTGRLRARSHRWELTAERTVSALQRASRLPSRARSRALTA